jgi:hypothetical protein
MEAYRKVANNQHLLKEDLQALIQKFNKKVDMPMKTYEKDLRSQWERRKHRIREYSAFPSMLVWAIIILVLVQVVSQRYLVPVPWFALHPPRRRVIHSS